MRPWSISSAGKVSGTLSTRTVTPASEAAFQNGRPLRALVAVGTARGR